MKNQKVKQISYLKKFKCIGSRCEDNCCIGWDVEIDIDTFKKYKNMSQSPLSERLKHDVVINKDSYDHNIDYGKMILKKKKICPFLAEDLLCDIHRSHGEDHLSKVCNSYPRVVNETNGMLEQSANISCPEVARLILLSKEKIRMMDKMDDTDRWIVDQSVNTNDKALKHHCAKYFVDLRDFAVDIVQDRRLTIEDRLSTLGTVLNSMIPYFEGKSVDKIPGVIDGTKQQISKGQVVKDVKHRRASLKEQLNIFVNKTGILDKDPQINQQRFGKVLKSAKKGLGISGDKLSEKSLNLYEKNNTVVEAFIRDNSNMFENYLVNYIYTSMFPFSEQGDPYAGYTMLIFRWTMIKSLMIGLAGNGKTLDEESLVLIIQSFYKTIDHHRTFMEDVMYELMDTGGDAISELLKLI